MGVDLGIDELSSFLVKIRDNCSYEVIKEQQEKVLEDGTRVIGPFVDGKLSYVERYRGFDWFNGRGEVSLDGKLIWFWQYHGGVLDSLRGDKENTSRLYDKLKSILRNFPRDRPFKRGPDNLELDGYKYYDWCKGTIGSFSGNERMFYNREAPYLFSYDGSLLKPLSDSLFISTT